MDAPVGLVRALIPVTAHITARVPARHPSAAILGTDRMGSGVVVDPAGLVLTVNYVVMGARRLQVTFPDGRRVAASVAAQDFESGLALLRARIAGLPVAVPGSFEGLSAGAPVFVIAATGPRERRVAGGVVTYLGEFDAHWEYLLDRGIMTTCPNPGFGGGPLFDMRGRVVGIASLNLNEVGRHSFAIPVEYFTLHRADLVRFGRVVSRPRRAWIGFFPHPVEEGLMVAGVVPRSPAERGGLKEGDLILSVDDTAVETRRGLYEALWRHEPGERVRFDVMRENAVRRVEIVSEDRAEFYRLEADASGTAPAGEDAEGGEDGPGTRR